MERTTEKIIDKERGVYNIERNQYYNSLGLSDLGIKNMLEGF